MTGWMTKTQLKYYFFQEAFPNTAANFHSGLGDPSVPTEP